MFNFTAKFLVKADDLERTEPATSGEVGSSGSGFESLNGFTVQTLDSFVKSGSVKTADSYDDDDVVPEEDPKKGKRPQPKDKKKKKEEPEEEKPDFGLGAKHRPLSDEEMGDYVNRIKDKTKTKTDPYTMPYIHQKNIKIVDGSNNEYDLKELKASIMKRPTTLLKQNEKMQHSDGTATQYYNIGLPALKGLAVNEKTGEFVVVDTCPGSGACKTYCYAMKSSYIMFEAVSMSQTRILNFLLNDPKRFAAILKADIASAIIKNEVDGNDVVIRWHDAGDFFSPQYTELAFDIARAFPDNTFYAYTKIADVAKAQKPDNFIINFSEGALPAESKKINMTQIKHGVVVQKDMFWDLIARKGNTLIKENGQTAFKDKEAWNEFKDRIVAKYKIKKDTILSYNQYMRMKQSGMLGDTPHKWNVVVPPGGGDNSANDPLVLGSYLMFH